MQLALRARRSLAAVALRRLSVAAAPPPTWLQQCSGLPLIAGQVEGAGRGLFALTDLPAGAPLLTASPVVAHPPHGRLDVCHHCLHTLPPAPVQRAGKLLCSPLCADAAERTYLTAQAAAKLEAFEARQAASKSLMPLLAARLACAVAQHAAHPVVLDGLCFARGAVEAPPAAWVEDHAMLRAAFDAARLPADFLSLPWYVGVMARLHLNAFRVDVPRMDVRTLADLARLGAEGNGTAVYLLPSLCNHACDPSAHAAWPHGDATLALSTRRECGAGEELRITYIDSSLPVAERQEQLHFAYGFACACDTCVDDLLDAHGGAT